MKIAQLSKQNLKLAARIYAQGLLMETPPGASESFDELVESIEPHLEKALREENRKIWLATLRNSVKGVLDFYHHSEELFIRFVCAIPPQQGTGTWLLRQLAHYAVAHQIGLIKATVSSIDSRAQQFYFQHLGFQKKGIRFEEPGFDLILAEISSQILLENSSRFG